MKSDRSKDYLVLGTVDDQSAISTLNPSLPVGVDGSGLHIQDTQGFFSQLEHAWWKVRSSDRIQSGKIETAGGLPDALIEGIEWPRDSANPSWSSPCATRASSPTFSTSSSRPHSLPISRSLSAFLHGSHFSSYRIGNDVYHVGSLSWWIWLTILFQDYQWLMVVSTLVACFFMAIVIRSILRRKARARLQGNDTTRIFT